MTETEPLGELGEFFDYSTYMQVHMLEFLVKIAVLNRAVEARDANLPGCVDRETLRADYERQEALIPQSLAGIVELYRPIVKEHKEECARSKQAFATGQAAQLMQVVRRYWAGDRKKAGVIAASSDDGAQVDDGVEECTRI